MEANITIHGERYELGTLTLGDMRLLRKHFGLTHLADIADMTDDPELIAGLTYLAFKRRHPEWTHDRLINEVDELPLEALTDDAPEAEVDGDPKDSADNDGK